MGSRIFVGNISYASSEAGLKEHFEQGGFTVVSARIIVDRDTGRSRGFGFVELGDEEQARRAIAELDGYELEGRSLSLREAHERKQAGGSRSPRPDIVSRPRRSSAPPRRGRLDDEA